MESKPGDNNQDKQSNDPNKDQNPNSTEQEIPQPEETKESTKDEVASFSTQDSAFQNDQNPNSQDIINELREKVRQAGEEKNIPALIHAYENLGREYIRTKKYKLAVEALLDAYKLAEKEQSYFEKLGLLLLNVSLAYLKNKDSKNAHEYAYRAANIEREKNGNTQVLANCYMTMGNSSFYQKNLKGAIIGYEQSYNIQKELTGEESLELLESAQSLAFASTDVGDPKSALNYHQVALKIEIKKFGEKDSKLIKRYVAISDIYSAQKKFKEAIEALQKAAEISADVFGEENLSVADIYWKIALSYSQMEDFKKCIEILKNVRNMSVKIGGDKYFGLVQIDRAMGQVYMKLNEFTDAEKSFKLGIEVYDANQNKDDKNYLYCMLNLAKISFVQEKLKEALSFALKAEMVSKKFGPQDKCFEECKNTVEMVIKKLKEEKDKY